MTYNDPELQYIIDIETQAILPALPVALECLRNEGIAIKDDPVTPEQTISAIEVRMMGNVEPSSWWEMDSAHALRLAVEWWVTEPLWSREMPRDEKERVIQAMATAVDVGLGHVTSFDEEAGL